MNPVTLTANDPEPPDRSVVLDGCGHAWQSDEGFWRAGHAYFDTWRGLCTLGTLTLIHRGPDPEPPATWRAGFGTPPDGTIVADDRLAPWMLEEGRWRCSTGSRSVSCDVDQLTRPCHVLRWGWTK